MNHPLISIHRRTYGLVYQLRHSTCCFDFKAKRVKAYYISTAFLLCGIMLLVCLMLHMGPFELRLLAMRSSSTKACRKVKYFTSQFDSLSDVLKQQIKLQHQLLASNQEEKRTFVKNLHSVSLEMLKKKYPICSFYPENLSGKMKINLDFSTLDNDLATFQADLKELRDELDVYTSQSSHFTNAARNHTDEGSSIPTKHDILQRSNLFQLPLSLDAVPYGVNSPIACFPHRRTAIIVPYRNRLHHLKIFLRHMHLFMKKQDIEYGIYIINLAGSEKFNRAKLLNIGFKEALRHHEKYDCLIFHDVDLLPEDDNNLYTCASQPKHMSIAIDIYGYQLPYAEIFGGVTAMTPYQFMMVNGYSNFYWGWGGEDDDMFLRIKESCMSVTRISSDIAKYHMAVHNHDTGNEVFNERYNLLKGAINRQRHDGLSSLNYTVLDRNYNFLYNNITVDIGFPMHESGTSQEMGRHLSIVGLCVLIIYFSLLRNAQSDHRLGMTVNHQPF